MSMFSVAADPLFDPVLSSSTPANEGRQPATGLARSIFALIASQVLPTDWLIARLTEFTEDQAQEQAKRDALKEKHRERAEELAIQEDHISAPAVEAAVKSEPGDLKHLPDPQPKSGPVEDMPAPAGVPDNTDTDSDAADGDVDGEFELRLTRGRLSGFPRPFATLNSLPAEFCAYKAGDHGNTFTSHWLFPQPNNHNVIVIASGTRKTKQLSRHLDIISQVGTASIEVMLANNPFGGFAYLGSFLPENVWLPFTEDYVSDTENLFDFWADIADPRRVDDLRCRWAVPDNGLFYCTLRYGSFNANYFDSLEHLISDTIASKSAPVRPRKRRRNQY